MARDAERKQKQHHAYSDKKKEEQKRKQGHRHFNNEHDEEQSRERMRENYAALIGEELNQIQEQSRVMMREGETCYSHRRRTSSDTRKKQKNITMEQGSRYSASP